MSRLKVINIVDLSRTNQRRNCIGGVWLACSTRVRYIVSSRPGRVKSKTIKVASTATPLRSPHYGVRAKTCWLGNRLVYPRGATCLPAACRFSELVHLFVYKSN
jgi:hypothetical protein